MKSNKKSNMRFLWAIIILLIFLNLLIVVFNKSYIYKGIYYTYLSGKTTPTIYDLKKFPSTKINKSDTPFTWENGVLSKMSDEQERYLKKFQTSSFLVIKDGKIIFEKYYQKHTEHKVSNSFSAAKTVLSLLIGIALDEGKISSLDESIANYIPEFKNTPKAEISIRHLLQMSSGLSWSESSNNPFSDNAASYYGSNLKKLVFSKKLISIPGKTFNYQSGNSQLLAYIIEAATGKDLSQYMEDKIWSKIGTQNDAFWSLDQKNGDEKAFCCIYGTSRDYAKLGQLILNKGKWNQNQIISEQYMKQMFQNPEIKTQEGIPNYRYGLHIWTIWEENQQIQYCRGIYGQYIIAIPHENMIIVRTGSKRDEDVENIDDKHRVGHPKDVFEYISIAKSLIHS